MGGLHGLYFRLDLEEQLLLAQALVLLLLLFKFAHGLFQVLLGARFLLFGLFQATRFFGLCLFLLASGWGALALGT